MEAVGSILAKLVDIAIFRVCFFIAGGPDTLATGGRNLVVGSKIRGSKAECPNARRKTR